MAHARASVHVLDATMFWSATGGGVRRYLRVKHAWITRQAGWRHTIAAPVVDSPDMALLPAWPLPGSHGYRLPVQRRRLAQQLEELQPDIIEAGDPYGLAWAALDTAQHLQIPAVAYCHSNLEALGAGPTPPGGERVIAMPFVGDAVKLATMLASTDAFVHAGDQATFGLSVLEALACGTPVVARAAEGLAELVDRKVGVPVPDGRADSFAQAISALFETPRNERSAAARRRARAYDWDGLLPSLLGQYQRLLQQVAPVAARAERPFGVTADPAR